MTQSPPAYLLRHRGDLACRRVLGDWLEERGRRLASYLPPDNFGDDDGHGGGGGGYSDGGIGDGGKGVAIWRWISPSSWVRSLGLSDLEAGSGLEAYYGFDGGIGNGGDGDEGGAGIGDGGGDGLGRGGYGDGGRGDGDGSDGGIDGGPSDGFGACGYRKMQQSRPLY